MKVDIKDIAFRLREAGRRSDDRNIEDVITERLLESINGQISKLTEQVIEEMQELEHPEPRNKAEYDERYGLDKE